MSVQKASKTLSGASSMTPRDTCGSVQLDSDAGGGGRITLWGQFARDGLWRLGSGFPGWWPCLP